MTGVSTRERGFQRIIAPVVGAIPALGNAGLLLYAALSFPELYPVAPVVLGLAAAMVLTVGGSTVVLLIGDRVPILLRLGLAVALAATIGACGMLPLLLTGPAAGTGITPSVTYMVLGAVVVLAGITSMCTTTNATSAMAGRDSRSPTARHWRGSR